MATTYYPPEKRIDRLPKHIKDDITFDLIHAFALPKRPTEAAQLLQDLLTKKELANLAKRLRIAKELLSGATQDEITKRLHCGFGTVARVQTWLREGGEGLRKTISHLPKRKEYPKPKHHVLPPQYRTPQLVLEFIQYLRAKNEERKIHQFLDAVDGKAAIDRSLREALDEYYRNRYTKPTTKYKE